MRERAVRIFFLGCMITFAGWSVSWVTSSGLFISLPWAKGMSVPISPKSTPIPSSKLVHTTSAKALRAVSISTREREQVESYRGENEAYKLD